VKEKSPGKPGIQTTACHVTSPPLLSDISSVIITRTTIIVDTISYVFNSLRNFHYKPLICDSWTTPYITYVRPPHHVKLITRPNYWCFWNLSLSVSV